MSYEAKKRKENLINNENIENERENAKETNELEKMPLETIDSNRCHNADSISSKKVKRVHSTSEQIECLKELLLNAKSPGSPSTSGRAKELPSIAGIYIKDFGPISLPLSSAQAEELIKKCSLTPCGEFISIYNKNKPNKIK
jgi:hypothetical protein